MDRHRIHQYYLGRTGGRGVDPANQHLGPQEVRAHWPTVYEKDIPVSPRSGNT